MEVFCYFTKGKKDYRADLEDAVYALAKGKKIIVSHTLGGTHLILENKLYNEGLLKSGESFECHGDTIKEKIEKFRLAKKNAPKNVKIIYQNICAYKTKQQVNFASFDMECSIIDRRLEEVGEAISNLNFMEDAVCAINFSLLDRKLNKENCTYGQMELNKMQDKTFIEKFLSDFFSYYVENSHVEISDKKSRVYKNAKMSKPMCSMVFTLKKREKIVTF